MIATNERVMLAVMKYASRAPTTRVRSIHTLPQKMRTPEKTAAKPITAVIYSVRS
jgi:hypothetical protein